MFVGQSIVKQYSHDNSCLSIVLRLVYLCHVWPRVKLFMSRKLFLPLEINSYTHIDHDCNSFVNIKPHPAE